MRLPCCRRYTSIRPLSTPRNSPNGTSASFRLPPLDSPSFTAITTASLLRLLSHNGYQHTRQDLQRLAHFILWLEQRSPSSTLPLPPAGLARLPLILLRTFLAVVLATLPFVVLCAPCGLYLEAFETPIPLSAASRFGSCSVEKSNAERSISLISQKALGQRAQLHLFRHLSPALPGTVPLARLARNALRDCQ